VQKDQIVGLHDDDAGATIVGRVGKFHRVKDLFCFLEVVGW